MTLIYFLLFSLFILQLLDLFLFLKREKAIDEAVKKAVTVSNVRITAANEDEAFRQFLEQQGVQWDEPNDLKEVYPATEGKVVTMEDAEKQLAEVEKE